jgi:alpha-tubulin suppressor-like RCC1 family protein
MIQEQDPDGDATYCSATTPLDYFLCSFNGIQMKSWPRPLRVSGLRLVAWVKTRGASSAVSFLIQKLNHQYHSAIHTVTSPTYTEVSWLLPQQPDGTAWTTTALAALTEPDGTFMAGLTFVTGDECWCTTLAAYVLVEPYPQWTLVSQGNGTAQQWTGVPAVAPAYLALQRFDGDDSYVESVAGGDVSLFQPDALGVLFPGNIDNVRVTALVKNRSSTDQTVTPILRVGGVDYRGGCDTLGTRLPPNLDAWQLVSSDYPADPSAAWPAGNPAGAAWTQAQVNTVEHGLENTSGGVLRCTSLATEVWLTPTSLTAFDLYPAANGYHQDFIPTVPGGGEAAWEDVDEEPPDDAASYIEASATTSGTPQYCSFTLTAPLPPFTARTVAGRSDHTVACGNSDTVYCWGAGTFGQLGDNTATDSLIPIQTLDVTGMGPLTGVAAVAAGNGFSVALKNDGTVWCWGRNDVGQLGDNTGVQRDLPVQVTGAGGVGFLSGISAIAAGTSHVVAVKNTGTIWCWGDNNAGQLGNNGVGLFQLAPVQVVGTGGVGFLLDGVSVAAGQNHTVAVLADNTVRCWGGNNRGQLGDNTLVQKVFPVQVVGLGGVGVLNAIVAVGAGEKHVVALQSDNTVWCWGDNSAGQLGNNGVGLFQKTPVKTLDSGGMGDLAAITAVAAGQNHTIALQNDATVWCWGSNFSGQLGNNTNVDTVLPVKTLSDSGVGDLSNVTAIGSSWWHTCAVANGSTIWCWGFNNAGQLGNNSAVDSWLPVSPAFPMVALERIYSVELRCRVRLGNLPGSTAVVAPVVRWVHGGPDETYCGKPITIESTGGIWFDVKHEFYCAPHTGDRWTDLAEVLGCEWGLVVLDGDVLVSRVRIRVLTCRDYPAGGVPDPIELQLTNAATFYMNRAAGDGTLYAVTEFSIGVGGYDVNAPGSVTAVNPADVTLLSEVYRAPLTHLQYSAPAPPWNVQYWCRVPRGMALHGIGEVGLWAKILWSPFPWEIDTFFLFAIQHHACHVRHHDAVGLYVLQVNYP